MTDVPPEKHAGPPQVFLTPSGGLALRAWLWASGSALREHDDSPRLWMHLTDGRVLALRLPQVRLGDDTVLGPLLAALANDVGGLLWELNLPDIGFAQVLYAAPVLPVLSSAHAGFLLNADYLRFAQGLDTEVIALLASLEREPTPTAITRHDGQAPHPLPLSFFASVRNYNRIAALPPLLRERRLQALARFPALTARILLTSHHSANLFDGRRHARRQKDVAVEQAIDQGRDLTGALARHYGISRALVRAPLNARMWPEAFYGRRVTLLRLIDALPANQRPDPDAFERWKIYLVNVFRLLGEDPDGKPQSHAPEVCRGAFRLGWTATWETAAQRFGNLHVALADCGDFLRAACDVARDRSARRRGVRTERLAAGWLARYGIIGLLAASQRWHARAHAHPLQLAAAHGVTEIPAVLGTFAWQGYWANELCSVAVIEAEGRHMRHCVATYWDDCVFKGTRIFHLQGTDGEEATAEYRFNKNFDSLSFDLEQLRGPDNATASQAMESFALAIASAMAETEKSDARQQVLTHIAAQRERRNRVSTKAIFSLDRRSQQMLEQVLAWLHIPQRASRTADEFWRGSVAGFSYHEGPAVLHQIAPGEAVELVREMGNPQDTQAVAVIWQGRKLGYVPRTDSAHIVARMETDGRLQAYVTRVEPDLPDWEKLEIGIRVVPTVPDET